MTTSAQIRRNQQNAKHSTGPRTIEGKNRSRFNAVKHACTAKLVLLPAEKPSEFNERTQGFFEHFRPQNPVEVVLTQDAVYCSWQLERCCEANWSRMREKAVMGDADLKRRIGAEFTELSEELFRAPNGRPTALPGGELPDAEAGQACRTKTNTAAEESPARVLRRLELNPIGVSWLLMEWETLNSPLQRGEGWNAAERFRATGCSGFTRLAPISMTISRACSKRARRSIRRRGAWSPRFGTRLSRRLTCRCLKSSTGGAWRFSRRWIEKRRSSI